MVDFSKVKGIIFDYGGTIDSRGDHWSEIIWQGYRQAEIAVDKVTFRDAYVYAERRLARERHIMPCDDFRRLMSVKIQLELQYLADQGHDVSGRCGSMAQAVTDIAAYCDDYARTCVDEAKPTLEALHSRYPMVLVSNFYGNIDAVLSEFGIRHLFQGIIESSVVGVRKPDPRIFTLGTVALGLAPADTLVVGDSLRKDILPAESIGCQVAWIKGRGWTADEDAATHPAQIENIAKLAAAALCNIN